MRILGMMRADAASEAGAPPNPELMERMGVFIGEVMQAGVLLATDGLHPSAKGKRVKVENGKTTVIDGPFTESKELVASYALFEVKDMDEAVMWTKRFLECIGEGQCELRPIFEPTDFAPDVISPDQVAREEAWRKDMDQRLAKK
jgi:hypothetical protein